MQAPQPSISGTRDYAGEDAVALQHVRDAIDATLKRYAYAAIDPPILESSSPFLNRSGEDIRRHMYIFPDPGGREVCLRPELTIPVCRAYLRQLQAAGHGAAGEEARLCYFGPAFRYEPTAEGRHRQFYQAGAELIGAADREAADAEILAVALETLAAAGLNDTSIEVGDVDIRNAFIDRLPVSERSKTRIRRLALRGQKHGRDDAGSPGVRSSLPADANDFSELASVLSAAEPGKAELLISELFALADVRHVGGRTPEEIVERLANRTQQAEPISAELMTAVYELLNIRGKPDAVFKKLRDHFRTYRIGGIEPVLERCEKRLRYFTAYRADKPPLELNVGLRRGLEYYTGFLFEVYAASLPQIGHVCGGGRYDNLLEGLGTSLSIPAVGFGIGLDRLLLALQAMNDLPLASAAVPLALVVAADSGQEEAIRVCTALRQSGRPIELDASGRDEKRAVNHAAKRHIPYVIIAGDKTTGKGRLRVRRTGERSCRTMSLAELLAELAAAVSGQQPGAAG